MEASFVVPGPLDVAGTLSRFHLWGEDPANRFADGVFQRARSCRQLTAMKAAYVVGLARQMASGVLDLDAPADLSDDEVIERVTAVRGFVRGSAGWFLGARAVARGGA